MATAHASLQREFFIDNLLVRIHFIIVMIRWTGLAPWEFEPRMPLYIGQAFGGSQCDSRLSVRYRGASLIRNHPTLGPYRRTMPRVLGGS